MKAAQPCGTETAVQGLRHAVLPSILPSHPLVHPSCPIGILLAFLLPSFSSLPPPFFSLCPPFPSAPPTFPPHPRFLCFSTSPLLSSLSLSLSLAKSAFITHFPPPPSKCTHHYQHHYLRHHYLPAARCRTPPAGYWRPRTCRPRRRHSARPRGDSAYNPRKVRDKARPKRYATEGNSWRTIARSL
jgi:hypothetical protein